VAIYNELNLHRVSGVERKSQKGMQPTTWWPIANGGVIVVVHFASNNLFRPSGFC
jgi:hypothetical protein